MSLNIITNSTRKTKQHPELQENSGRIVGNDIVPRYLTLVSL